MGLFNFFSSKRDATEVENDKCKKIEHEYDFFETDVANIFKYDNINFTRAELNSVGYPVNIYEMNLDYLEMGIFNKVQVIVHPDGEKTVVFKSITNSITQEFIKFINFCASKYGPEMFKNTDSHLTESEIQMIKSGLTFGRMWNEVSLGNYGGTFELTLFNVPTPEYAQTVKFVIPE